MSFLARTWKQLLPRVFLSARTTSVNHNDITSVRYHSTVQGVLPETDAESMEVKPFHSVPGPSGIKSIPFIGTMLMMKPFGRYTVDQVSELLSDLHVQYGPIVRARMGRHWIVYVERLEDIERTFRAEGACPKRPLLNLHKVYQDRTGRPNSLTTLHGEEWRKLRSPLNARMNRPASAACYLPAQNQVADDFVRRLATQSFTPARLREEFFKYATESIGVVCFSRRLGFLSDDLESRPAQYKLLQCFKTNLHCTGAAMMGREFTYLFYRDKFYKNFERATNHIMSFISDFLHEAQNELSRREREGTGDTGDTNLVLSLLSEPTMDIPRVMGIIEPLLTAGSDSTASSLQMLLYHLARHPDKQQLLADHLRQEMGDGQPLTADTLSNLKYLAACVKESLRLSFPLPSGVARILPADLVLSGYLVPKGTTVGLSSQRTAMNPDYFPQPAQFLPERWLRNVCGRRETSISGFAYLPFGFGPRNCIGRRFAEQEMYLAAAKLIHKLHVSLPAGYDGKLETEYRPFVTPKHPLPFIFTPRH